MTGPPFFQDFVVGGGGGRKPFQQIGAANTRRASADPARDLQGIIL